MEFMASLQGGLDELKPSLFELLSEQQLSSLLPPSLRYLLAVATHRHPRHLLRILNSFDELYALLMLALERYYLKTYGGSFTENFYGLKRERVLHIKGGEIPRAQIAVPSQVRETLQLRDRDIWRNLAVLVGVPYLKRKLDESYDIHAAHASVLGARFQEERLAEGARLRERIFYYYKWFLRKCYPTINAAYYLSTLLFSLAYLFDTSKYHSPFQYLIGTRIRRLGEADHRAIAAALQLPASVVKAARPGQGNSIFNPRVMTQTVGPKLLGGLKILLPTSIFALKFLEWWYGSDFARQLSKKAKEGLELPPPVIAGLPSPVSSVALAEGKSGFGGKREKGTSKDPDAKTRPPISSKTLLPILTVPAPTRETSSLCPVCGNAIVNATAAPSGFVYDYTCIHTWVEGTHERQIAFMEGGGGEEGWGEEETGGGPSREGRWESGRGRDPVTGRRILGGTELLRRVII
ncbi:peroxisome assembly protein 12 [Tothia fuscella]|uniref:Peroxisome assembly protein 12 n=1 Tax=Tothia fuscella TaxID=1048955 RepID=A0A9P4U2W5_9PEZI|nr:peroxisome assembly protein 12 [Tothia fuscella]